MASLQSGIPEVVVAAASDLQSRTESEGSVVHLSGTGTGGAANVVAAKDRAAALKEKAEVLKAKARKLKEDAEEKQRAAERARLAILRKAREKEEKEERERERARERERELDQEREQEMEREKEMQKERERERELESAREKEQEAEEEKEREREREREQEREVDREWERGAENGVDTVMQDAKAEQSGSLVDHEHGSSADAAPLDGAVEALVVASMSLGTPRIPLLRRGSLGSGEFSRFRKSESFPEIANGDHEMMDAAVSLSPLGRMGRLKVQIPDRLLELQMEDLPEFPGGFGEKASPAEDAAAAAMLEISMTPTSELHAGFRDTPAQGVNVGSGGASTAEVTEGRTKRKRKRNRMYFDDDVAVGWHDLDTPRVASEGEKKSDSLPKPKKKLKITFKGPAALAQKDPHSGKNIRKLKSLKLIKAKASKAAAAPPKVKTPVARTPLPKSPLELKSPESPEDAQCPVCQALRRFDCGAESAHPRCIKAAGADNAAVQGGPNAKAAAVVLMAALNSRKDASFEPWAGTGEEQLERVPVWEPVTGKRLVGEDGPRLRNLASWLLLNPGWEVLPRGELEKPPPPAEPEPIPTPAPPAEIAVVPTPLEELKQWRGVQAELALLLQAWSSLRGRADAGCFGSSQEAVAACRFLDPDFGPLCDLLGEERYADLETLLADFSRACNAAAVVRINDLKKGCYAPSSLHTSPARFVGAAEILIRHGSADLRSIADGVNSGRVLRDGAMVMRSAYTNKEPMTAGPWRREPWPRSTIPALIDTRTDQPSGGAEAGGLGPSLAFDVDVGAVDGWGVDPFTRRGILDALPKDAAREGGGVKSRAKTVGDFVTQKLLPALNDRGPQGWDIFESLKALGLAAGRSRDASLVEAVTELAHKMMETGPLWFRVHPKGTSLVCQRAGGLDAGTCVASYPPSTILRPYQWFELQEGLRKQSKEAELKPPNRVDFLLVEQAATSKEGYEVFFVDVRNREGAPPTQLLHSCQATCQPVIRRVQGRPTVDIQTAQRVEQGQELTLNYTCYTDSDDDVTRNVCLCGMPACRGSCFVHLGRGPATAVLNETHSLPDRLAVLLRASSEDLTAAEEELIVGHGFGPMLPDKGDGHAPAWLRKWAALALGYIEREQELVARALQGPEHGYSKSVAAAEAKHLLPLRLQHLYITLDRVQHCLAGQPPDVRERPPLRALNAGEVCEYLWTGRRSVGRCLVGRLAPVLCPDCTARGKERLKLIQHPTPGCAALHRALRTPSTSTGESPADVIKAALNQLAADISAFESDVCVAARDLLRFLTSTETFIQAHRYDPVTSAPVSIPVGDVSGAPLSQAGPIPQLPQPEASGRLTGSELRQSEQGDSVLSEGAPLSTAAQNAEPFSSISKPSVSAAASRHPDRDATNRDAPESGLPGTREGNGATMRAQDFAGVAARSRVSDELRKKTAGASSSDGVDSEEAHTGPSTGRESAHVAAGASADGAARPCVVSFTKTYPGEYILAQLLFWHRNAPGFDPVAALGESLRGTCLLPDAESVTRPAVPGERATWLRKLTTEPGGPWPSQWRFKEDALQATLGNPLVDAAIRRQITCESGALLLPPLLLDNI
ncbi:hypothetical protein KFL_000520360 [Klebsormidium nitens]|uniref:BRK domain-containing protein n=1 Tax=Klebsormidium nitens TaxID=105231 RepID=A0A1Y1HP07_KLENI|nr:hypothetical protein KFL_000520360 [Klebsormidium nitens]|eukprot:GAQ80364.1 hypothetical protein KFL_000520360 [Klebsormidium nitens]